MNNKLQDVFNQIAPGWYRMRHWSIFRRELETLAQRWQKGKLLNAGCGHGADFLPFKDGFDLYGVDFSIEMLRLAHQYARKFNLTVNLSLADVAQLPYRDGVFDRVISVATYHHLRGKQRQLGALNELRRVLTPGGEAFITVWNHWQPRFWFRRREVAVPWRVDGKVVHRYYYLFSYRELETLVKEAGLELLRSFPESSYRLPLKHFSRNICLLVRKSG